MRPGRLCTQLALAWLLAGGAAAAQTGASTEWLVVRPGQSASEIALDRVPAGTTIDQFLLALYQLNPQAFAAGDLNRLQSQARLRLPTADEANRVGVEPAREQLSRLKAGTVPATASQPAEATATTPSIPTAAADPAFMPPAAPAPSAGTASTAPAAPAGMVVWVAGAMAVLGLLAWRLRRPRKSAPAPRADTEALAQGRFQPVLPREHAAAPPASKATPPTQHVPATVAAPAALFDLDLNLNGPAPPLNLPPGSSSPPASPVGRSGLGPLPDLDLPPPRAAAPGPLDLGGLSLDLDPPAKGRP